MFGTSLINVIPNASALGASLILPLGNLSAIYYKIRLLAPGPKAIEWKSILSIIPLSWTSLWIPYSGKWQTPSDIKYKTNLSYLFEF